MKHHVLDRRHFLKTSLLGGLALTLPWGARRLLAATEPAAAKLTSRVAVTTGGDRADLAFQALKPFAKQIAAAIGEPARARDMDEWRRRLVVALSEFVVEFDADCVHVGGGNARHLGEQDLVELGCPVAFNDNEGTLRGAVRLFLE